MLLYLLPDGKSLKCLFEGCVELLALQMHHVVYCVCDSGIIDPDDLLTCPHCPLQGLGVRDGTIQRSRL